MPPPLQDARTANSSRMPLVPPKAVFAVTAVTDLALSASASPVRSRDLAMRLGLSERCLEPVLQALARHGILKSTRGPCGGYRLARQPSRITADEIVRALGTAAGRDPSPDAVLNSVVLLVLAQAEGAFCAELSRINIEALAQSGRELESSAAAE